MTSCGLSLFFLVCLCSSIAAVDPSGLKVRLTDRALDVLKDISLEYLKQLENKPFADFPIQAGPLKCTIKGLTLTRLTLNPAQVRLSFMQGSGLQLEIQKLVFTGEFERQCNIISNGPTSFGGEGVSAKIGVTLSRTQQGRVIVGMPTCVFEIDKIITNSPGIVGRSLDLLIGVFQKYLTTKICPAVQTYVVPKVNSMLESVTMTKTLYEGLGINIDYSLSGDVAVTSSSLDVPFKGLVFTQGGSIDAASIRKYKDPVFRESNLMAYVGVSEFFFNSAMMSLFSTGAMALSKQVTGAGKAALRTLQVFRQPLQVRSPLSCELEVTEAPSFSISQKDGITVNARARVRGVAGGKDPKQFLSVSATCTVNMKVAIKGNYLTLPSDNVSCKIITKNKIRDVMVKPLNAKLTNKLKDFLHGWFSKGALIPLPEGMGFTQGKIDYHDGFVVVGGSLNLTPAAREKLVKDFGR